MTDLFNRNGPNTRPSANPERSHSPFTELQRRGDLHEWSSLPFCRENRVKTEAESNRIGLIPFSLAENKFGAGQFMGNLDELVVSSKILGRENQEIDWYALRLGVKILSS